MPNPIHDLLTREQAAARLAVGVSTVDWMRRTRRLETVRERRFATDHPTRIYVRRAQVEEIVRERELREDEAKAQRAEAESILLASQLAASGQAEAESFAG